MEQQLSTLGPNEAYTYLGMDICLTLSHIPVSKSVLKKIKHKLRAIDKSLLSMGHTIRAIEESVIGTLRYSAGIGLLTDTDIAAISAGIAATVKRKLGVNTSAPSHPFFFKTGEPGMNLTAAEDVVASRAVVFTHTSIIESDGRLVDLFRGIYSHIARRYANSTQTETHALPGIPATFMKNMTKLFPSERRLVWAQRAGAVITPARPLPLSTDVSLASIFTMLERIRIDKNDDDFTFDTPPLEALTPLWQMGIMSLNDVVYMIDSKDGDITYRFITTDDMRRTYPSCTPAARRCLNWVTQSVCSSPFEPVPPCSNTHTTPLASRHRTFTSTGIISNWPALGTLTSTRTRFGIHDIENRDATNPPLTRPGLPRTAWIEAGESPLAEGTYTMTSQHYSMSASDQRPLWLDELRVRILESHSFQFQLGATDFWDTSDQGTADAAMEVVDLWDLNGKQHLALWRLVAHAFTDGSYSMGFACPHCQTELPSAHALALHEITVHKSRTFQAGKQTCKICQTQDLWPKTGCTAHSREDERRYREFPNPRICQTPPETHGRVPPHLADEQHDLEESDPDTGYFNIDLEIEEVRDQDDQHWRDSVFGVEQHFNPDQETDARTDPYNTAGPSDSNRMARVTEGLPDRGTAATPIVQATEQTRTQEAETAQKSPIRKTERNPATDPVSDLTASAHVQTEIRDHVRRQDSHPHNVDPAGRQSKTIQTTAAPKRRKRDRAEEESPSSSVDKPEAARLAPQEGRHRKYWANCSPSGSSSDESDTETERAEARLGPDTESPTPRALS